VLTSPGRLVPARPTGGITARARLEPDQETRRLIGAYLVPARRLGRRTGLLHLALAGAPDDPAFAPEPYHAMHQQSIYQGARALLAKTFQMLRRQARGLPDETRALADAVLAREKAVDDRFREVTRRKYDLDRIRCHGDLHLGQVLFLGDDFLIIDFEGEPARRLNERRYKRAGLRDVTGMLRSFGYVAESTLRLGPFRSQDVATLEPWARAWVAWVSAAYLGEYLHTVRGTRLLPKGDADRDRLLDFYTLEKCVYEIAYEMMNRPTWLAIPLRGLLQILDGGV
jgi:maltose alpha-D-glucosyltransferase/alpha-amylase